MMMNMNPAHTSPFRTPTPGVDTSAARSSGTFTA